MFRALLFALFFYSATAIPYICHNDSLVLNATNLTFYLNTTSMADNQACTWEFTLPMSYVAEININASSLGTPADSIKVYSQMGEFTWSGTGTGYVNDFIHIMWPPPNFTITIYTGDETSMILAVNIALRNVSISDKPQTLLTTSVNQQPYFIQFTDWKEDTVIKAQAEKNGSLFLAVAWALYTDPVIYANVFVYDETLQFLGTLYSLTLNLNTTMLHYSTSDTLIFYRALGSEASAVLAINDYSNIRNFRYTMFWSPSKDADNGNAPMFATQDETIVTALTVVNAADGSDAIYVESIGYELGGLSVKVLAGGMILDYDGLGTEIATYYFNDTLNRVPQFLPGTARTFVVEQGQVVIDCTSNGAFTKNTEATDGRAGFVMSNNYPFVSPDQNFPDFVLNSVDGNAFIFEYTIAQQNSNPDAYLNFLINGLTGKNNFTVDLYTVAANSTFNVTAFEMTMSIFGGSGNSTGTYISYKIISTDIPAPTTVITKGTTASTQPTTTSAPSIKAVEVTLICVGIILFLIAVIVGTIMFLRYKARRGKLRKFWISVSGVLPIVVKIDKWELGDKQLEVIEDKELGQGAFATVFEGKLTGSRPMDKSMLSSLRMTERNSQVAVKRLPSKADLQARLDFLAEVNFMKKLGYHPHILGMIGCITASGLPMIVLDYCENGDLLSWARKHKYSVEGLQPKQLLTIAWQISDGLCYLKSINLLHRDLAARNILLTRELLAKISDFGLSCEPEVGNESGTYMSRLYVSRSERLPIKWMAPESLRDFQFSFKTEIWSYGVLLWELFTFGDIPFVAVHSSTLLELLEGGERLPQGGIPDAVYALMASCWDAEPKKRETIEKLKDTLNGMLKSGNDYGYLMVVPWEEKKDTEEDLGDDSMSCTSHSSQDSQQEAEEI